MNGDKEAGCIFIQQTVNAYDEQASCLVPGDNTRHILIETFKILPGMTNSDVLFSSKPDLRKVQ